MATVETVCLPHARGRIRVDFTPQGLCRLSLPTDRDVAASHANDESNPPGIAELRAALARYFAGEREDFSLVPLDLGAATEFQRQVWTAARAVTWGKTSTYGELAEKLKRTRSSARAVGHALGANPIAIVIPCHRFLAANGDLVGFAAGLEWKRELLRLEGSLLS